jgi:hypothetical protein
MMLRFALTLALSTAIAFAQGDRVTLRWLGTAATGIFGESAAEIVAHDPGTQRLFVVNARSGQVDVIDVADPTAPTFLAPIVVGAAGEVANSVAVHDGLLAVAIEAAVKTDPGRVAFFTVDGAFLTDVTVGALPDMLTFTPDGSRVLVANEGEPSDDYGVDPEGSVSILDLDRSTGLTVTVRTVDFRDFDADGPRAAELPADVRVFGPNARVSQDLEPEYIAVSADGLTAFVSLQEANAFAVIDVAAGRVERILALGFKDHAQPGAGLDPSDRDGGTFIRPWPVFGMYQPDAIAAFTHRGQTFIVSANEGDARDTSAFAEETRVRDLTLDPVAFPNAGELVGNDQLGRLTVTTTLGDADGDGRYEALYVFGARSFSVWAADGTLVFDSGDAFEQIIAERLPAFANANHELNGAETFDNRSDNKGPEPEGVTIGVIDGVPYAFITLERIGGVMIYDLSDPTAPAFAGYANHRNFDAPADSAEALDLGPESAAFISAEQSPTGTPLLVVANEVSGTTSIFEIHVR